MTAIPAQYAINVWCVQKQDSGVQVGVGCTILVIDGIAFFGQVHGVRPGAGFPMIVVVASSALVGRIGVLHGDGKIITAALSMTPVSVQPLVRHYVSKVMYTDH